MSPILLRAITCALGSDANRPRRTRESGSGNHAAQSPGNTGQLAVLRHRASHPQPLGRQTPSQPPLRADMWPSRTICWLARYRLPAATKQQRPAEVLPLSRPSIKPLTPQTCDRILSPYCNKARPRTRPIAQNRHSDAPSIDERTLAMVLHRRSISTRVRQWPPTEAKTRGSVSVTDRPEKYALNS